MGRNTYDMQQADEKLFSLGQFSDLKIRCGAREWAVHKAILCPRSEYFDRIVNSGFKKSHENLIELHDENPDIVHLTLEWLYNERYVPAGMTYTSKWGIHKAVFEIADKYLLKDLQNVALQAFLDCEISEDMEGLVKLGKLIGNMAPANPVLQQAVVDCLSYEFVGSQAAFMRPYHAAELVELLRETRSDFAIMIFLKLNER
ncbi:uncharacterized protein LTR77_008980 [Saxophila tyrrhenica]|uniref:BTB domain-containing protein n=1 Tax=Saxophila tyrrhenica TaxID=1690608 RepID=A0AAV9P235_9PEZI|nr:hypothetical protein LTR77_008980 [Saxophila tyrrhenica]